LKIWIATLNGLTHDPYRGLSSKVIYFSYPDNKLLLWRAVL